MGDPEVGRSADFQYLSESECSSTVESLHNHWLAVAAVDSM
jgi:hypothetical protein